MVAERYFVRKKVMHQLLLITDVYQLLNRYCLLLEESAKNGTDPVETQSEELLQSSVDAQFRNDHSANDSRNCSESPQFSNTQEESHEDFSSSTAKFHAEATSKMRSKATVSVLETARSTIVSSFTSSKTMAFDNWNWMTYAICLFTIVVLGIGTTLIWSINCKRKKLRKQRLSKNMDAFSTSEA